ncbi:MAG TPA: DNA repair protein RadC [Anaerolineae bacterium]|nr:DNA repair protein RadC [Anaerolineae bacterium]HQI87606.1 DNA repair protein RadC [Anaerolineae bacterium]
MSVKEKPTASYFTVKEMPEDERPRERMARVGPQALSTPELLALILRTGVKDENVLTMATRLLMQYNGLAGLARAEFVQIAAEHGLGPAKTAQILAALELGRRLMAESPEERFQIRAPQDAANLLMPMIGHKEQEHFVVLYLDTRNRVLDQEVLYKGSLNTSLVRIGEVFRGAVRRNCMGVIVAHNHPSGDPTPSAEDIALTRRLVDAGKLLEVELLDHVIIGHNRFVSLRERALGFEKA